MSGMKSKTNIRSRDACSGLIIEEIKGLKELFVRNQGQRPIYIFYYLISSVTILPAGSPQQLLAIINIFKRTKLKISLCVCEILAVFFFSSFFISEHQQLWHLTQGSLKWIIMP